MAQSSKIEWTDATWNPVTGCTKVSPGCKNCYAETMAERWRGIPGHPYEQGFDLRLWEERLKVPLTWRKPRRIFVNSMSDLFHEEVPADFIDEVFQTMREATWHHFQVLTKRADRMADYVKRQTQRWGSLAEESPHIWLGTSIETQAYLDRAKLIASVPAAVRFLSCEPLLGPLDLHSVLGSDRVNWVIVGGESGPGARPIMKSWVEEIQEECSRAGVPFFFKQWGGVRKKENGRVLHEQTWDEFPVSLDEAEAVLS